MDSVTVKISTRTGRGKHLIALLNDLAKDGDDIEFENIPNSVTLKAMKEIDDGKVKMIKNSTELFKELGI